MSEVGPEGRSYLPIERLDLERLLAIAEADLDSFFRSHPIWAHRYGSRLLAVALCQGAALHYIDGATGVNDFDLYTFFKSNPEKGWYAKRLKAYDFGDAKFGQSVDKPRYIGRRVDCMGRSISVRDGEDTIAASGAT